VSALPRLQALLSRSREPQQAVNPQLHSGLVFGFWVTSYKHPSSDDCVPKTPTARRSHRQSPLLPRSLLHPSSD
jgi:hypothetical protein